MTMLSPRPSTVSTRPRSSTGAGHGGSFEAVEFATLAWVDWFNNRRLLEPIGNIPPAEAEERYYAMTEKQPAMAARLKRNSLRQTRGGSSVVSWQDLRRLGFRECRASDFYPRADRRVGVCGLRVTIPQVVVPEQFFGSPLTVVALGHCGSRPRTPQPGGRANDLLSLNSPFAPSQTPLARRRSHWRAKRSARLEDIAGAAGRTSVWRQKSELRLRYVHNSMPSSASETCQRLLLLRRTPAPNHG